ncbi:MAG: Asp-tRNA(Asn)/Glu-tRNA(Gln) amidotransferase GatCAB subunit A, partial [Phycisphaeraceae bacterium]
MDPTQTTLIELRDAIAAKTTTAAQATRAYLDRIERLNPTLNSYREVIADDALKRAARVDAGEITG